MIDQPASWTANDDPELDCQQCGACCTHGGDVMVPHADPDVPLSMRRSVRNMRGHEPWEHEYHSAMDRRKDGACIAFEGKVGGLCACSIYALRPESCQHFERGSEECLLSRAAAGLSRH